MTVPTHPSAVEIEKPPLPPPPSYAATVSADVNQIDYSKTSCFFSGTVVRRFVIIFYVVAFFLSTALFKIFETNPLALMIFLIFLICGLFSLPVLIYVLLRTENAHLYVPRGCCSRPRFVDDHGNAPSPAPFLVQVEGANAWQHHLNV